MGSSLADATKDEQTWLDAEEKRCVATGAWRPVERVVYCSRVFLVDKAGFDSVLGVPKKRLVHAYLMLWGLKITDLAEPGSQPASAQPASGC
jgi:hypothetical protein